MHVIKNCNSPCVMCDCWKTKKLTQLTDQQIEQAVIALKEAKGELVMVSGGEPLLRKNIRSVLQLIKDHGLKTSLNTNGVLLKRRFEEFKDLCDYIVISIDSADRSEYLKLRGLDALDEVIENIKFVQENTNAIIQFRCTISRANLFSFDKIIDLARNLGISGIGFSPIDHDSDSFGREAKDQTQDQSANDLLPSTEQIAQFREMLKGDLGHKLQKAFDDKIITWDLKNFEALANYFEWGHQKSAAPNFSTQPCFFPYSAALIDYDGSVRPCFYTSPHEKSETITADTLTSPCIIDKVTSEKKCATCRGRIFT